MRVTAILTSFSLVSQCLRKWGFRRCEDICWIKTNKNNPGKTKTLDPKAVFIDSRLINSSKGADEHTASMAGK